MANERPAADTSLTLEGIQAPRSVAPRARLHIRTPVVDRFREDVLAGLAARPKRIPPKYFYDERGSQLFEAICQLPEYPITRTETALMERYRDEMAACLGTGVWLIEYGSGNSRKSRLLLEALRPAVYMPVDISLEMLEHTARELALDYPWLRIEAVWADYAETWELPRAAPHARRIAYFPGSSVGNFDPEEAQRFLAQVACQVGAGGGLLIGIDLKRGVDRLTRAYDDAGGVTAQFNLNLLLRINRELGGDFVLECFRHLAFYNETLGRVEMHLQSTVHQQATVAGRRFSFFAGEAMHTENSYKYSVEDFEALAQGAGFGLKRAWIGGEEPFAVLYLEAVDQRRSTRTGR